MDTYVILRRGAWESPQELGQAAERSRAVGDEQMAEDIRWIRSYVLREPDGSVGTVCIYEASSPEAIREHASRAQHVSHSTQRDRLPEVRKVMQRIAAVDKVSWFTRVPIGQEPGTDGFDVGHRAAIDVLGQPPQHDRRDVHRGDRPAALSQPDRIAALAAADVDRRPGREVAGVRGELRVHAPAPHVVVA